MTAGSASAARPAAVESFAESLAGWLSSFTVPQELAAEMASACAAGAPWAAALAGTSARRAGWPEREALAWGVGVGALAGALEAGRRSLGGGPATSGRAADGPALPLLAADGLIAGAHEALASLEPERLAQAMEALGAGFGDGGPWGSLSADWPRPAWPAVVAIGLGPAAGSDPGGPWSILAAAWRDRFAAPPADDHGFREPPVADAGTKELFAAAARAALEGDDGERF